MNFVSRVKPGQIGWYTGGYTSLVVFCWIPPTSNYKMSDFNGYKHKGCYYPFVGCTASTTSISNSSGSGTAILYAKFKRYPDSVSISEIFGGGGWKICATTDNNSVPGKPRWYTEGDALGSADEQTLSITVSMTRPGKYQYSLYMFRGDQFVFLPINTPDITVTKSYPETSVSIQMAVYTNHVLHVQVQCRGKVGTNFDFTVCVHLGGYVYQLNLVDDATITSTDGEVIHDVQASSPHMSGDCYTGLENKTSAYAELITVTSDSKRFTDMKSITYH